MAVGSVHPPLGLPSSSSPPKISCMALKSPPPPKKARIRTVSIEPSFLPSCVSPSLSPALPIVSNKPSSSSSGFRPLPPKPNASRSSSEITEIAP